MNTSSVESLDPDQDGCFVDLGLNCLKRISADYKSSHLKVASYAV